MDINMDVLQFFTNFWLKITCDSGLGNENISNKELAEELHKPIIRNCKNRKVYSSFVDNIWGADLINMELKSKFNKGIFFLICVNDIFFKYTWVAEQLKLNTLM